MICILNILGNLDDNSTNYILESLYDLISNMTINVKNKNLLLSIKWKIIFEDCQISMNRKQGNFRDERIYVYLPEEVNANDNFQR